MWCFAVANKKSSGRRSKHLAAHLPASSGTPRKLDELDRQLIAAYRRDGRTPANALAAALDASHNTVLARTQKLIDDGVLVFTAQRDLTQAGFELGIVELKVAGGATPKVVHALGQIPEVQVICEMLGTPQLYMHTLTRSRESFTRLVRESLPAIKEIENIDAHYAFDIVKYSVDLAALKFNQHRSASKHQPDDDFDERITALLKQDGRLSNTEIARKLCVSEAAVRQRLKKLTDAKTIRIGTICDSATLGLTTVALLEIDARPTAIDTLNERLIGLEGVTFVAVIDGRFQIVALLLTESITGMHEIIRRELESVPGVQAISVRIVANIAKHEFEYALLSRPRYND
jgi:Lrp/AsnC family transcriptional regulator for asnA, asnC and gidA